MIRESNQKLRTGQLLQSIVGIVTVAGNIDSLLQRIIVRLNVLNWFGMSTIASLLSLPYTGVATFWRRRCGATIFQFVRIIISVFYDLRQQNVQLRNGGKYFVQYRQQ